MKSGGMPAGLASTAALAASNREEYRELGPLIDLEVLRKEGAAVEDRETGGRSSDRARLASTSLSPAGGWPFRWPVLRLPRPERGSSEDGRGVFCLSCGETFLFHYSVLLLHQIPAFPSLDSIDP
jgi:hypothetical protein